MEENAKSIACTFCTNQVNYWQRHLPDAVVVRASTSQIKKEFPSCIQNTFKHK